jgi:quinol monooxygenase YgiN
MTTVRRLVLAAACLMAGLVEVPGAQAPGEMAVYAVAYVEVLPSARPAMLEALSRYREGIRNEEGHVHIDAVEQVGRPGHFAIVETWRDQPAFDLHAAGAAFKRWQDALQPIRVSGYDQRPYKTFAVAPAAGPGDAQAVYVVSHVDIAGPQPDAPRLLRGLAEASRQEDGCLRFDIVQHAMRANHFTVVEVWRNQQALDAHASAPHTKTYRDRIQPMTGSPLDERVYRTAG